MNQSVEPPGGTLLRKARYFREARSKIESRRAEYLVWAEPRIDGPVRGRTQILGEDDRPVAADAVPERLQAVGRGRAVTREATGLAARDGLVVLAQRALKVPSRCSSAFEIFCAGASVLLSVAPGACAYG